MTPPGGDAADRALDDALALANEPRAGAGPAGPPANDPLAVALGHEPGTRTPQPGARTPQPGARTPQDGARRPAAHPPATRPAPMPRPGTGRPATDPLTVAFGDDQSEPQSAAARNASLPARPAAGDASRGSGSRRPGGDPLAVLFGNGADDDPGVRQARPVAERDQAPATPRQEERGGAVPLPASPAQPPPPAEPSAPLDAFRPSPSGRGRTSGPWAPADPVDVALSLGDEEHGARRASRASHATPPPGSAPDPSHGSRAGTPSTPPGTGVARPDDGRDGRGTREGQAHPAIPWPKARRIARQSGRRLAARATPLGDQALGTALARSLVALTDLPSFDSSAMDGWAVAGEGPWLVKGQLLAGQRPPGALHGGHAVRVATGSALPAGTTAVLRSEHGRTEERTDGAWLVVRAPHLAPVPGQEIRRRGQECRSGDELLRAGTLVTPTVLGLAAAAGYDELTVTARPRVEVLVLGDELLDQGLPRSGQVRDALGPMLPSWLRALGAEVSAVRRLVDDANALHDAVTSSRADVIVTTGGTAGGPVDHVHPVLAAIGARLLVDGVAVRPGHPMLLAALPPGIPAGGGHLVGLPGNPLAAASGMLTLVAPLLRTLGGRPVPAPYAAPLTEDVQGHPSDTRLVPVVFDDESAARPLHFAGPAMLRGLAAADGMAVIPPGGARAGDETAVLDTGALGPAWGSGA
ncbi:molybdopterin-binding protein [Streptomyces sp. NPDC020917]|uniref:molybdopterin molybdotransferase MoeA n=1 Tax=Streptomyces sp. NPDC020917 TaxID=3365102 RepID=UPI0037A61B52